MARKTEERIADLKQLRTGSADEAVPVLRKALADKSNLVVAEAARISAELHLTGVIPDLVASLTRLFENPVKSDPKCWGKTALVKALTVLDHSESTPFLRAVGHIQMEPVWGDHEDSAVHLRANALLALVQCSDLTRSDVFRHVVDALDDESDTVRIEAVRTLEQMNGDEAALLLRLKAYSGDERSAVTGQVFDSLLALEREKAVKFVARFLESENPEVRDEAALSLGASRLPSAVGIMIETWKNPQTRDAVLLRALSSSREETALAFLLDVVREGISRDSAAALEALDLHRDSPEIQTRVEEATRRRS